jgi:proteic killer suppression protein
MIKTWANRAGERFFREGKASSFRGLDAEAAQDLPAALDAATNLGDLSPLKSVGLHKLKGDRAGQWAMTVNARWRICFRFKDGDAYDVAIVDYHRG